MQKATLLLSLAAAALATPNHIPNVNQTVPAVTMPLPPLSALTQVGAVTVKTMTMTSACPSCPSVYVTSEPFTSSSTTTSDQTTYTTTTTTMVVKACPSCPGTSITMVTSVPYVAPTPVVNVNNATTPAMNFPVATGTAAPSAPVITPGMPLMAGSSALSTSLVGVVVACLAVLVVM